MRAVCPAGMLALPLRARVTTFPATDTRSPPLIVGTHVTHGPVAAGGQPSGTAVRLGPGAGMRGPRTSVMTASGGMSLSVLVTSTAMKPPPPARGSLKETCGQASRAGQAVVKTGLAGTS
jgi:hypothetical protein